MAAEPPKYINIHLYVYCYGFVKEKATAFAHSHNPPRAAFDEVILGGKPKLEAKIASGDIKVEGQKEKLGELLALLDKFDPWFNIVTP